MSEGEEPGHERRAGRLMSLDIKTSLRSFTERHDPAFRIVIEIPAPGNQGRPFDVPKTNVATFGIEI